MAWPGGAAYWRRRVGRRGAFLAVLAVVDLSYGGYLFTGGTIGHVFLLPVTWWGAGWMATGAFLLTGVLAHPPAFYWPRQPRRQYGRYDAVQFTVAVFFKCLWGLEYLLVPLVRREPPWDWLRGIFWLALTLLVLLAAGWPDPDDQQRRAGS